MKKEKLKIRLCRESDAAAIVRLDRDVFKGEGWNKAASIRKVIRENPKTCWALEVNGKLKGVRLAHDEKGCGRVWGWLLVISKELRHHGLGTAFLNETARRLGKMGFRKIYAETEEWNKGAIEWHKKNGYKIDGKFRDWFGKGEHAIVFSKDL